MRPKKQDRAVSDELKQPLDSAQSDRDLFLQAFEKPTQIYRYLRIRQAFSPVFLYRTLKYMTGRCKRKANTREFFKVESLLTKKEAEFKQQQVVGYKQDCLNLTFSSFHDKENTEVKNVDVEVSLIKVCHSKRKDITVADTEVSIGKVTIPRNPTSIELMATEAISIPSDNFCINGSQAVKSYYLRVVVTNSRKAVVGSTSRLSTRSRESNSSDLENQDPPPKKKLRRSSEEKPTRDGKLRGEKSKIACENISYRSELIIYDKHKRCLLTDGDYEVSLDDAGSSTSLIQAGKRCSWEFVSEGKAVLVADIFDKRPVIKFTLTWNQSPLQNLTCLTSNTSCDEIICNNRIGGRIFDFDAAAKAEKATLREVTTGSPSKRPKRIFYQFLFNNNMRQQTEAREDCRCPWCCVNCLRLPSLLAHLRCCHARFNFTYVEHPKGARIDVSINDCYDGSYVGNPQDSHSHVGFAFSRGGPVRRMPVTVLLINRSKKSVSDSNDLQDGETDASSSRQHVHGHNRLYYHSITSQPIRPCEIDIDSEDEIDPEWLRQKTQNMIDEFTDVNEGEKELMKLWNLHMMRHNYIGDCRLITACETFVSESGPEIVRRNLGRNFILHLVNLFDFGLIRPEIIYRIAIQYFRLRRQLEDSGALEIGASSAPS